MKHMVHIVHIVHMVHVIHIVHLVHVVHLVHLVHMVHVVHLLHLVHMIHIDSQDYIGAYQFDGCHEDRCYVAVPQRSTRPGRLPNCCSGPWVSTSFRYLGLSV